jgi:hypothetical protein
MNFKVNVNERLSFLSTGLVRRFNSVIRSLPTSLNVSLIVDYLVDKIGAKSEEESRKAELVYLLNEVIGGKSFHFYFKQNNSIFLELAPAVE